MARSVLTPLRITQRGGVDMTPANDGGARSLIQVIVARLSPGETLHPFDVATGRTVPGGEYSVGSARQTGEIEDSVRRAFADLEAQGRARLDRVLVGDVRDDGRRSVDVAWTNLELGGQPGSLSTEIA